MRYRKKAFWPRLAALDQVDRRFWQTQRSIKAGERRLSAGRLGEGAVGAGKPGENKPTREELAQCQALALEMGTCLEGLGKAAEPVVRLLEDYCECLYQQSRYLEDDAACRMISRKVQKLLGQIQRMIQFDLPEGKKEVVFLPYKASMWDSLESVWQAAKADADCAAFVVPIPYFDREADGSLGQMHDEKDQYPPEVPVTDWREYKIRERCPDMIFIHNPYDDANRVTSVHPAFYAKELKKYTDMLVYIPYFIGINGHVAEHLCVLPGILHADRVIVESEEVRQVYLEEIRRFEEEEHCPGLFGDLEQKILGLGSPKLDRVRSMAKDSVQVPKTWEPLLELQKQGRKKVILYNTSIEAFCQHGAVYVEKIRSVLQTFKTSREVILLWRPHPLLMQTIRSMGAELYPAYRELVQRYRQEGWGIYDDTPDAERAIALSDAYYGDWSSLVTLYQATGKPIMIQSYGEG